MRSHRRQALLAAIFAGTLLTGPLHAEIVNWTVDASGLWTTATNWSSNPSFPGPTSDVIIDRPAGDFVVTLSAGVHSINTLLTTEALTFSAGTLTLAGLMDVRNTFTLSGGVLAHANITKSGAGSIVLSSGLLDNLTLSTSVDIISNQSVTLRNNLSLNGGATLSIFGAAGFPHVYINGNQSITGTGTILLDGNSGYTANISNSGASTVTLGPSVAVRTGTGNSATMGVIETTGLINQGVISSETANRTLAIISANWSSSGTLQAINGAVLSLFGSWSNSGSTILNAGTLNLGGTVTTAGLNLPGLTRTGGAINIVGLLNNSSAVLPLAATGNITLVGGTVTGGTVTGGGAQLFATSGVLDNVSLAASLSVGTQQITLRNNLNLNGSTITTFGTNAFPFIYINGSQSITGTGTIVLDGNSGYTASISNAGDSTLTLSPSVSVRTGTGNSAAMGTIITAGLINQGVISSESSTRTLAINSLNWSSSGTLQAVNGGILALGGNWSNSGSMIVNAGTLNFGGTVTTAGLNLPGLTRTGGAINITGLLNNASAVLPLTAATGNITLAGGTITGGTITGAGGAQLLATTGVLDNVSLAANLSVGSQQVTLRNNLTLNGSTISLFGTVAFPNIFINGSQSITGNGTILLDGNSGYTASISNSGDSALTLGPSVTVRTGTGSSATLGTIITTGLINQGVISSETLGKTLAINSLNWSSAGTLQAVSGGILALGGNWSNSGAMIVNAGTLNLGGAFTTTGLNLPGLTRTGGAINITGLLNNASAVLPLTAATGNITLAGGTITGGTITGAGGAQLLAISGVLDNVSLATSLSVGSQQVTLRNNLNLNGSSISLFGTGAFPVIFINGSQSITGSGTILLDGNSGYTASISNAGDSTLTLGPSVSVRTGTGNSATLGTIITTGLINQGLISSESSTRTLAINSLNWSSSGTLQAVNGGILTLGGNWSNSGSMIVNAGTLNFGGTVTTTGLNLPGLTRTGGAINITGLLNNASAVLPLTAATGNITLAGGTITGGSITGAGGAQLLATTGVLDNVSLAANLSVGSQQVTLRNSLTLDGSTISLLGTTAFPVIFINGSQSITGAGIILLDGNTGYFANIANSGASTLTLGPSIIVRTGTGNSATLGVINTTGLINQGVINLAAPGKVFTIASSFFSSSGTVTGPGNLQLDPGSSTFSGPFSVSGITTLNGHHATFSAPASTAAAMTGPGSLTLAAGAALTSDGVRLNSLSVAGTHTIRANGSNIGASLVSTLTIAGAADAWTGKLDITNNAFIVQANSTNKAALILILQNQVFSGRAAGTWTGNGITSSTLATPAGNNSSLAIVDNADLHLGSYRGIAVNDNSLIVVQAANGDATLDGKVDAFDLNILAAHWQQQSGAVWAVGDFNHDTKVDAFDLNILAGNWQYGTSLEAALSPSLYPLTSEPLTSASPIPEPASLLSLLAFAPIVLRRRSAAHR